MYCMCKYTCTCMYVCVCMSNLGPACLSSQFAQVSGEFLCFISWYDVGKDRLQFSKVQIWLWFCRFLEVEALWQRRLCRFCEAVEKNISYGQMQVTGRAVSDWQSTLPYSISQAQLVLRLLPRSLSSSQPRNERQQLITLRNCVSQLAQHFMTEVFNEYAANNCASHVMQLCSLVESATHYAASYI